MDPGPKGVMLLGTLLIGSVCSAQEPKKVAADSPRRTPTVALVQRCLPSVVALQTVRPAQKEGTFEVTAGSGSIIHSAGFILTNDHVVARMLRGLATLPDGRVFELETIARFPHEDVAVLRVAPSNPLPAIPLGRSNDLMLGEPVIAIGTPAGLAHTVSNGIVSGLNRSMSTEQTSLPHMIQTNAAISGGNSGGPLINALGEQIGLITSKKTNGENLGFAIGIDRIREIIRSLLAPEQRQGIYFGAEVSTLQENAVVVGVVDDSPASHAGMAVGDVVLSVGGMQIEQGVDFYLALLDKKVDQPLTVKVRRADDVLALSVKIAALPLPIPVAQKGLANGLRRSVYRGNWDALPDFDELTPASVQTVKLPTANTPNESADFFGLRFDGFVRVPKDGLYWFATESDDGSRMFVAGRLVVDNDNLHAARRSMGPLRLKAGIYPLRVDFFEKTGDEVLKVFFEGPGFEPREIPASAYFTGESPRANKSER